eukprot:jgi/Mesen1/9695/ME000069S09098
MTASVGGAGIDVVPQDLLNKIDLSGVNGNGTSEPFTMKELADGLPAEKTNGKLSNGTHEASDAATTAPLADLAIDEDDEEEAEEEVVYKVPKDRVKNYGVDDRDANTPDRWIKRHPELVRLTGKHPFNCEAPLTRLMEHGFITPVPLHYVRNHGAVPQCDWDTWTVEIKGLVRRPLVLTMKDILALPSRTLPVTLVCAGNRRKEENMVKQSIGFNWGAAAVSTTVWRGARLSDVLRLAGILPRSKGALHVCFEGAEILPGGGGSRYGTSLRRELAMDPAQDILLAYEQNGAPLEPDHGFPVRLLIPGFIGGRMVKWLKEISVTESESDNYYHFNDNRVLPSHVDAEMAKAEGWWYKPDYIINELNINSAITTPAHGEVVSFKAHQADEYTIKGYAYSGGGRKVIRVEVSIDGGETWMNADVAYPERPTAYGKYWCWCLWTLQMDLLLFLRASEIVVRAWDSGMNTQPQNLTWNVMGMMNNCWFRVKVHPTRPKSGGIGVTFEHPTRPGNETGGWMVKGEEEEVVDPKKLRRTLGRSLSQPGLAPTQRVIPMSEVAKHDSESSAWIVVHNKVYDCTKFLEDHPGGADSILINAGMDATEEFDAIHSSKAKAMLEDYLIGELTTLEHLDSKTPDVSLRGASSALASLAEMAEVEEKEAEAEAEAANAAAAAEAAKVVARPVALDPKKRIPFTLIEKHELSPDTRRFRFALQSPEHILGLPCGKHMFLSANIKGKFVMRAYTPTSSDDDVGHFDLVIKVYYPNVVPQFPDGGLMSFHLENMAIGETIDVKGPLGHIHYLGKGHFTVNGKPRFAKRIAMLAGGTGITPMYQVAKAILKDLDDPTEVSLMSANRSELDVLLKDELDWWAAKHSNFKTWYTINATSEPGIEWPYSIGYLTVEMMREHLPAGDPETFAFMCGPPPMLERCCKPNLKELNYADENILTF